METIDGMYDLNDTESAIQSKEAEGFEMKTLRAGAQPPPTNEADFKDLPAGELPDDFHLTLGNVPTGKEEVWSGTIYVQGKLKAAKGYRG